MPPASHSWKSRTWPVDIGFHWRISGPRRCFPHLNVRERLIELDNFKETYGPLLDAGYSIKYFDPDGTVKFFKLKNGVSYYEYDDKLTITFKPALDRYEILNCCHYHKQRRWIPHPGR